MSVKKALLLALCVCFSFSVFSQWDDDYKPFRFGLGTAISLPTGDLKDASVVGVGFELTANYAVSENMETYLQTGVDVFKAQSDYYGNQSGVLHVPALAGVRLKAAGFFAGAGAGYGYFNSGGNPLKGFLYSPQIGYDTRTLQVMAQYTSTAVTGGALSYFGIKVFRLF